MLIAACCITVAIKYDRFPNFSAYVIATVVYSILLGRHIWGRVRVILYTNVYGLSQPINCLDKVKEDGCPILSILRILKIRFLCFRKEKRYSRVILNKNNFVHKIYDCEKSRNIHEPINIHTNKTCIIYVYGSKCIMMALVSVIRILNDIPLHEKLP
jgi:hypothetical protein